MPIQPLIEFLIRDKGIDQVVHRAIFSMLDPTQASTRLDDLSRCIGQTYKLNLSTSLNFSDKFEEVKVCFSSYPDSDAIVEG